MQSAPSIKSFRPIPNTQYSILLLLLLCSLFSLQCKKDLTTASSSAKLTFSTNLVFFDTVFAGGNIGSSVRVFVVHNNNSEAVNVSSINVSGSSASFFKINVDGLSGSMFSNIKIPANDSIYVFTQVNVNTLNTNNPLVIEDSLVFITNGNVQSVHLQAFGWNAYYYVPNILPASGPAYYILKPTELTWTNDKPHIIFGYLLDTSKFTIQQGTHVYFHDSATLYITGGATLNVTGTFANPVTFQGDRLEPAYQSFPGQWNGIFLAPGSINNNISWAIIQNGTTGVQADTVGNSSPTLTMDHTIIKTMSAVGLVGEGATITANNCLIADCQYACLALEYGGSYTFDQCTFADYWGVDNGYGQRTSPLLYINDYYQSTANQTIYRPINKAFFGNCILYGALTNEVKLDSANNPAKDVMNYYFENCVIRTTQSFPNNHYNSDSSSTSDPLFADPSNDNYEVNAGSPALQKANPAIAKEYSPDLAGKSMTAPYTIGAYQQ